MASGQSGRKFYLHGTLEFRPFFTSVPTRVNGSSNRPMAETLTAMTETDSSIRKKLPADNKPVINYGSEMAVIRFKLGLNCHAMKM